MASYDPQSPAEQHGHSDVVDARPDASPDPGDDTLVGFDSPAEAAHPVVAHLAGLTVLASAVAIDPSGWYPFVVAKWAAVSMAIVAAWMAAGTSSRSRLPRLATVAFTALVIVIAMAAVFGRERLYAWVGTPERQLGVFTWVLFAAAIVVGTALNSPARRRIFSYWVVVALGWCVAYGAAEFVGIKLIAINTNTSRLTGPYGSASFFGAALCLLVPVTFGLAADAEASVWWRRAAFVIATLGVATVAVTGTRAAWLGLGVAVGFLVMSTWVRGGDGQRTRLSLTTISGVGVGIIVGAIGVLTASGVTDRSAGSSSRLAEWGVGLRIVAAHPWLGVGPEGYRTALADGVTATYERTYGRTAIPDRAHNTIIDVAAAGGVAAAALYVFLIVLVVVAAWRVVRLRPHQPVATGLAIAAVAYAVQQLFLFPLSTIDPVFWMLAGSTLVTAWPTSVVAPARSTSRVARLTLGSALLAALLLNSVVAIAADRSARIAIDTDDLAAAEQAAALRPDVVRYHLLVASLEPVTITGRNAAIAETNKALRVSPNDPILQQAHADALLRLALATGLDDDIGAAIDATRRLVVADPNCYSCALALGYASALGRDTTTATEAFARAATLARPGDLEAESALRSLEELAQQQNTTGGGTDDGG